MKAIAKLFNPFQETKGPQGVTITHKSLAGPRLFAVTQKDLSIGEQAFFAMLNNIKPEEQETEFYKILGPLSPNATWVKEGDEIKVKEIVWHVGKQSGELWKSVSTIKKTSIPKLFKKVTFCQVLGPCGHFH